MRVLLSGASGFIGSALVRRLDQDGHEVLRLTRAGRGGDATYDLEARTFDSSGLPDGDLASVDVVFHLAGEPITPWRWSAAKRERIRASRVVSTDVVARAIAAVEGRRPVLVAMSAIGFYGDRDEEHLDESSAPGRGTLAEVCLAWEAAAAPAREAGARVVNVRTGVVLGPGGGALKLQVPLYRAGLGGRLGSGRQWMSWVALEDEVGALVHAATTPAIEGPCNATAPTPVRNAQFNAALAAAVHRPALLVVPRLALELVAGPETTREVLCVSQRVEPTVLESTGYRFAAPRLEDALAAALHPQGA